MLLISKTAASHLCAMPVLGETKRWNICCCAVLGVCTAEVSKHVACECQSLSRQSNATGDTVSPGADIHLVQSKFDKYSFALEQSEIFSCDLKKSGAVTQLNLENLDSFACRWLMTRAESTKFC